MFNIFKTNFNKNKVRTIIFEAILECNLNCKYCYNVTKNSTPYPKSILNTEQTKIMLDKIIKESGCYNVTFTGGEPFLRKDLFELIKFAKERVLSVNMISNGTLLNEENIIKSIEAGIDIYELPLLSSDRLIHNALTRENSFDKTTEAIALLKSHGAKVVIVFVATKENIHTIKETFELALALGADGIMLNRFNPGGEGRNFINELLPSPDELHKAMEIANNIAKERQISVSCSIAMHPCLLKTENYPELNFGFCGAGTDRAYYTMDPLGNIRMCNHSQIIIGNIFKNTFNKITKTQAAKDFLKAVPKFCSDCKVVKECQGGCKASAEVCYNSIVLEDPFLKSFKDKAIKK